MRHSAQERDAIWRYTSGASDYIVPDEDVRAASMAVSRALEHLMEADSSPVTVKVTRSDGTVEDAALLASTVEALCCSSI